MAEEKIQEMQILEHNLQAILMQKQAFEMEIDETAEALKQIEESKDDVFKIIGQIMVKSEKDKIISELSSKNRLLELRLKSIEKQEKAFSDRIEKLRNELIKDRD